jgi:hypothetical protein
VRPASGCRALGQGFDPKLVVLAEPLQRTDLIGKLDFDAADSRAFPRRPSMKSSPLSIRAAAWWSSAPAGGSPCASFARLRSQLNAALEARIATPAPEFVLTASGQADQRTGSYDRLWRGGILVQAFAMPGSLSSPTSGQVDIQFKQAQGSLEKLDADSGMQACRN